MIRFAYSKNYNIGFFGLERLHPFDSRKYGRIWRCLKQHFGAELTDMHLSIDRSATADELLLVHSPEYLSRLRNSKYVSQALEISAIRRLPNWIADRHILRPMRWAVRGTMLAAEAALTDGFTVNLGGGYHHAKPDRGEGFSIYSDVGIAIAHLRLTHQIPDESRVVYIDTDAHQGNGVCQVFESDNRVFIFDIFNCHKYPMFDVRAKARIDCPVAVTDSTTDEEYLSELYSRLPGFLDSVCRAGVGLAIYNAGTDVFANDPLGGLNISAEAILKRDLFVVSELRKRNLPTTMVLSGGYTKNSYRIVADSMIELAKIESNEFEM